MIVSILLASVVTFGAVGDGVHDDTRAIQAALDSGDDVFVPRGRYRVARIGTGYCELRAHDVAINGDGEGTTTIVQSPGAGASVRTLCATGGVAVEDLTFDGSRALQSADEHRAAIFATDTQGLTLRRVTARAYTGDGLYLYRGAVDTLLEDVTVTANGRNGITMGATVTGVVMRRVHAVGNVAQQVDSEPGGTEVVSDVLIEDSELVSSGDFALTVSGSSSAVPGHGWRVIGNRIDGGVFVVWADDVLLAGNRGTCTAKCITVERSSTRTRIAGNVFKLTGAGSVVSVIGTAGSGPSGTLVVGNALEGGPGTYGIRVSGATDVTVVGNDIAAGLAAVYLRATVTDRPFVRATVTDNVISGSGLALSVAGVVGTSARLLYLEAKRNRFGGLGVSLDDGSHALVGYDIRDNVP